MLNLDTFESQKILYEQLKKNKLPIYYIIDCSMPKTKSWPVINMPKFKKIFFLFVRNKEKALAIFYSVRYGWMIRRNKNHFACQKYEKNHGFWTCWHEGLPHPCLHHILTTMSHNSKVPITLISKIKVGSNLVTLKLRSHGAFGEESQNITILKTVLSYAASW